MQKSWYSFCILQVYHTQIEQDTDKNVEFENVNSMQQQSILVNG